MIDEHGVHMDVDCGILDDPPQLDLVEGVTTHFGKCTIDSLLDRRGKKELKFNQMSEALKT